MFIKIEIPPTERVKRFVCSELLLGKIESRLFLLRDLEFSRLSFVSIKRWTDSPRKTESPSRTSTKEGPHFVFCTPTNDPTSSAVSSGT